MSILKENMEKTTLIHSTNNQQHPFHIVKPSPWPILVAFSVCLSLIFSVLWIHDYATDVCFFLNYLPIGFIFFFFAIIS